MDRLTKLIVPFALLALASACAAKKPLADDNAALLAAARQSIDDRDFLHAIQTLGDIGMVTPVSETVDPEKNLALADAYFFQNGAVSIVEAQTRYQNFLNFYPLHPRASYARYQIGACLLDQAESPENDQEFARQARDHLEKMVREIPANDTWMLPARRLLARAQDLLAEHEWIVAQYYLERKSLPGAIGRLGTLIDSYPAARRREESFFVLAAAYRTIGDKEQARLTLRRELDAYPDGKYAAQAAEALKSL